MRTVFFDIDTQIDFMFPAGALYVPGAEHVLPAICRLNSYAVENDIPLLSTMDAHSQSDPEFSKWPPHCIAGTIGQRKPVSTLFGTQIVIPSSRVEASGVNAQQILLEKLTTNCFDNPNLEAVLSALSADRYVVYGVVTEICVQHAVRGLLKTSQRVELVTDAIKHLTEEGRAAMLAEFVERGGIATTVAEVCAG